MWVEQFGEFIDYGGDSKEEILENRDYVEIAPHEVFSWGGLGFRLLDNMVRLYALGVFIAGATPLEVPTAIVGAGIVILIYTVIGGLWAVVVTDVVQFVILIFTALLLVPLSVEAAGGFGAMQQTLPEHFTWFNGPKGAFWYLLAYYIMIVLKYNGNWAFIQRFYSVRDEEAGRKAGLLMAGLFFVFPIFFLLPAIAAKIVVPGLDNPEMAYVAISTNVLPAGIMGILLAAMFAATMSASDAEYNVMAGVVTRDIYRRLFRPEATDQQQIRVARVATTVIGGLVIVGALYIGQFGGAFEANKLFTSLFGIPMVVPVLFGVLLAKPRPWGAITTLVVGALAGLLMNVIPGVSWAAATLIQIVVCVATISFSGYFEEASEEYQERIAAFFKRIRTPVAGQEEAPGEGTPRFQRAVAFLFAVVFGVVGLLFSGMSAPSLDQTSGVLSMGIGIVCLLAGGVLYLYGRQILQDEEVLVKEGVETSSDSSSDVPFE
jgi:Na+/proline symporter